MAIEIVGGPYSGAAVVEIGALWAGPKGDKFQAITFLNPRVTYQGYQIVRMKRLNEESAKSFIGTALAAGAGALLLGPIGLLAGAFAGGNKKTEVYGIEFDDGKKVIIKDRSDDKAFQCLKLYVQAAGSMEADF